MSKSTLLIFFLSGFFIANAQSVNENKIMARVGSKNISLDEFLFRYELTPQLMRENKNIKHELKKEFLYSLVAEKLLALYVEDSSIDTAEIVQKTIKNYEEMFVRDALYRKEIVNKSSIKKDSLFEIYLSTNSKVALIYLSNNSKDKADLLFDYLKSGASFDSLYSEIADSAKDTLTITRGQINQEDEDKIFNLKEGSFTHPIFLGNGWYVFKLLAGSNPVYQKAAGWENEYKNLKKLAKARAENELYKLYMLKFFNYTNAQANAKLMKSLGYEVYKILSVKEISSNKSQKYFLEPNDLLKIKNNLGADSLSMVYIKIGNRRIKITLDTFIDYFHFEQFYVDTLKYQNILSILNSKTKNYIEHKLLSEEGYRQGLQYSSEVKKNLNMWKENYYSQLVTIEFMDSVKVRDNDYIEYLNKTKKGTYPLKRVNLIEFFTDSLEIAAQVLNKLDEGNNLEDIISIYGRNKSSIIESGYFPVSSRGEIGKFAEKMRIGDVYGPVGYQNGYLIFKLIGIEEDSSEYTIAPNVDKEEVQREIKYNVSRENLNQFIAKLANKYGFLINEEAMSRINVTSISSVIYNYLGFGGKILAVPLLTPNMEWIKYWEKIQFNP